MHARTAEGVEIIIHLAPMPPMRQLGAVRSPVIMSEETRHPDQDGVSGKARQLCLWFFSLPQINNAKTYEQTGRVQVRYYLSNLLSVEFEVE